jgi:ankyrin repeat protein
MLMVKARLPHLIEGMLLQNADRSLKDQQGMTALDLAKQLGYSEIVELLTRY